MRQWKEYAPGVTGAAIEKSNEAIPPGATSPARYARLPPHVKPSPGDCDPSRYPLPALHVVLPVLRMRTLTAARPPTSSVAGTDCETKAASSITTGTVIVPEFGNNG